MSRTIVVDYKCNGCGEVSERFLHRRESELSYPVFVCGSCGGVLEKQLSAPKAVLDSSFPGARIKREKE